MQLAVTVQHMLGLEDKDTVAHGYTFERKTIDIWFENGKLVREDYNIDGRDERIYVDRMESERFDPRFFTDKVKRFYRAATNEELVEWWETFNPDGLPLV